MLHTNTIVYSWQTPESVSQEKKKNWYWILGLIALAVIVVAILMTNYLLVVLVVIGVVMIVKQSQRKSESLNIEISEEGINIHDTFHPYESIRSFWIKEKEDGEVILILLTSQAITPLLSVTVPPEIDPLELREYLLDFIVEEELRQSYTERIIEKIGL